MVHELTYRFTVMLSLGFVVLALKNQNLVSEGSLLVIEIWLSISIGFGVYGMILQILEMRKKKKESEVDGE
jgi:hypothetical protein